MTSLTYINISQYVSYLHSNKKMCALYKRVCYVFRAKMEFSFKDGKIESSKYQSAVQVFYIKSLLFNSEALHHEGVMLVCENKERDRSNPIYIFPFWDPEKEKAFFGSQMKCKQFRCCWPERVFNGDILTDFFLNKWKSSKNERRMRCVRHEALINSTTRNTWHLCIAAIITAKEVGFQNSTKSSDAKSFSEHFNSCSIVP